jgi:hypothetical protein
MSDPKLEILGLTISYPDWSHLNGSPDRSRFDHKEVTLQIRASCAHLRSILGISGLYLWQATDVITHDVSPDYHPCPGAPYETVLDRLYALGYLDSTQVSEVKELMQSHNCGDCCVGEQPCTNMPS